MRNSDLLRTLTAQALVALLETVAASGSPSLIAQAERDAGRCLRIVLADTLPS